MTLHIIFYFVSGYITLIMLFYYGLTLWNIVETKMPPIPKRGVVFFSFLWPLAVALCAFVTVDYLARKIVHSTGRYVVERRKRKKEMMDKVVDATSVRVNSSTK